MLDTDENSGTSGWLYYFRYIPYLFLALLCYVMGYVLMAFKKRRYTKENAGICDLCKTTESGRASGHVCDGWGLIGESVWLELSLCMEKHFSVQKI